MTKNNYSSDPVNERIKKALPEQQFVIDKLKELHGIEIMPSTPEEDKNLKIDGWLNDEPVQIKVRKTTYQKRNDILYEVLRRHDREKDVDLQLQDSSRVGRDYLGEVVHYFIMNQEETMIYHAYADELRKNVNQALSELGSPKIFTTILDASNGTQLRPTLDPRSKLGKILAFIPIDKIAHKIYHLDQTENNLNIELKR